MKAPDQPKHLKRTAQNQFWDGVLILIGVFSTAFGLKGFLLPSRFLDGGITGVSLLLAGVTRLPLSLLIFGLNLPFIFISFHQFGKTFALKTLIAVSGLALCVAFIEFPTVTEDKWLIAAFGGFFIGVGIGLVMRGGGVLDGTETLALFLSRKWGMTIGDVLLIINLFVFVAGAMVMGIETAFYAILTYLTTTKTVNFIIHGIEEYTAVTIISAESDEIRIAIIEELGRGVTVYRGKRGFGKRGQMTEDNDIVYCVMTRLEVPRLKQVIMRIDPTAFVVMHSISESSGGMLKRRPLPIE
jgi:uncharacterized membrane-anchored protein YitT (DUF2179 family)